MEVIVNAIDGYIALYGRFYHNAALRDSLEEKILKHSSNIPLIIRFRIYKELVTATMMNDDQGKARQLVDDIEAVVDAHTWPAHVGVPIEAQIAEMRYIAGQQQRAEADADAAMQLFESERANIFNMDRPDAILPLAEAYHAMGRVESARQAYSYAIEDGGLNPNARVRCEDLTATCVSMATSGFEPDEPMWGRLRKEKERLGPPW